MEELPEVKGTLTLCAVSKISLTLYERFSIFTKLKRVVFYILGFAHNLGNSRNRLIDPLSTVE